MAHQNKNLQDRIQGSKTSQSNQKNVRAPQFSNQLQKAEQKESVQKSNQANQNQGTADELMLQPNQQNENIDQQKATTIPVKNMTATQQTDSSQLQQKKTEIPNQTKEWGSSSIGPLQISGPISLTQYKNFTRKRTTIFETHHFGKLEISLDAVLSEMLDKELDEGIQELRQKSNLKELSSQDEMFLDPDFGPGTISNSEFDADESGVQYITQFANSQTGLEESNLDVIMLKDAKWVNFQKLALESTKACFIQMSEASSVFKTYEGKIIPGESKLINMNVLKYLN